MNIVSKIKNKTFTTAAVHLCMKDPSQNSHTRDCAPAHPCGG